MGLFGPPDVARLVAKGNIEGLVSAGSYRRDPEVRRAAAAALAGMTDQLIVNLQSHDLRVLRRARKGLQIAGRPAVEALVFVITDGQSVHRRQDATFVLGEVADQGTAAVVAGQLADPDPLLRTLAAEALGKIGGAVAEQSLRGALKDQDPLVARMAAKAIGRLGKTSP